VLVVGVAFYQVALAIHIMAVVVTFGVLFAYPLIQLVGDRLDPRAIPWYHRVQEKIGQRLISPGLLVVLVAGIYLASKLHQWSFFYVQWGVAVSIVIGALGGVFFSPNERRLAELAERDVASAGAGDVVWSPEYLALRRRNAVLGNGVAVLVLVTIYLMTVQS
jgi:Predicted integral membrane protein (DUF2269)